MDIKRYDTVKSTTLLTASENGRYVLYEDVKPFLTEQQRGQNEPRVKQLLADIEKEYDSASKKFKPFSSTHEGYAVILEELDEMWDEIKANRTEAARRECSQVAAMALRFLIDIV